MNISTTRLKKFEHQLSKSGILDFTKDLPKPAEIYLVGGTVRDILINRKNPGDLDLVVRNVEINILEKTLKKFGKVDFVGKNFGIFKFQPNKTLPTSELQNPKSDFRLPTSEIDVALPRTEHSFGTGAYKDFKITYNPKLPIKKDLSRRDFTINSIAYQLSTINNQQSHLIDPFHGLKDSQKKVIKTVGNPKIRFREDYSRLLRAIRIACELNFEIEKKTLQAIKKQMPHINDLPSCSRRGGEGRSKRLVPHEIIATEILKSFQANPVRALDLFDETGALRELIPELLFMKNCPQPKKFHSEGDVWTHTRLALSYINSKKFKAEFPPKKSTINNQQSTTCPEPSQGINNQPPDIELILAALFHDIGKPATIKISAKGRSRPEADQPLAGAITSGGKNNKISFRNHAQIGAQIAKNICQRLKFSAATDFNIKCQNISHLVAKHMLYLYSHFSRLKNSTIVKYFLLHSKLGGKLLKLFWLDSMASIPETGKPDLSNLEKLKKKIFSLKKRLKTTKEKTLLTGHDIIKEFNLPSGPKIGKLLSVLHEAHLAGLVKTKKSAISFLKREVK